MVSFILLIKLIASSIDWLGCLSRYLFISLSERKAKILSPSSVDNRLSVSLAVVKVGKGVKDLFTILSDF